MPTVGDQSTTEPDNYPIQVIAPRPDGWLMLHHATTALLMSEHSTVIKTYLALGLHTDPRRHAKPSIDTLATLTGTSRSSVIRAIKRLEEIGVLHVQRVRVADRNEVNRYTLTYPGSVTHDTTSGVTHDTRGSVTHDTRGSVTHDTQTRRRNEEKEITPISPVIPKASGQALEVLGGKENAPLSSAPPPADYWTPPRLVWFDEIAKLYPNNGADRQSAMQAWQATIGTRLDGDEAAANDLWFRMHRGAQWYAKQCKGVEQRYIKRFPNWIREQAWNDASKDALERKPA